MSKINIETSNSTMFGKFYKLSDFILISSLHISPTISHK